MEIIDYFKSDKPTHWLAEIKKSDWRAAPFLAKLIEENSFHDNLGEGTLLLLTDGDRLVSFVTFAERDSIDDDSLSPWIGFVYTFPEYRGHRNVGKLICRCEKIAAENGVPTVFVCTDHVGLYEKYGFSYMESRPDIYGGISRIYRKNISKEN
ncbi:MAG: GNAT family N-acetyltransferase [Oscillospiraceae bacterium]|nr:GNAT family N-acetyltransferase [Oscillospiraceae bacterium]